MKEVNMETATLKGRAPATGAHSVMERLKEDTGYQAFLLLRIGFAAAPILFGLDKFFDVLVNWEIYLAPWINDIVPGSAADAMYAVGVIEIAAGIAVAVKPRYGAYLVAAWLGGIIINLLTLSGPDTGPAGEQVRPAWLRGPGLRSRRPGAGRSPAPGHGDPSRPDPGLRAQRRGRVRACLRGRDQGLRTASRTVLGHLVELGSEASGTVGADDPLTVFSLPRE
jgi:hypothetical protein